MNRLKGAPMHRTTNRNLQYIQQSCWQSGQPAADEILPGVYGTGVALKVNASTLESPT